MARVKKIKFTVPEEIPAVAVKNNAELFLPPPTNFRVDRLTKELFILITIYGAAILLVLIGYLTVFSIVTLQTSGFKISSDVPACGNAANMANYSLSGIIYSAEKSIYKTGDQVKLSITNNSNISIYLIPCQYFSKFEKKSAAGWQSISLNDCAAAPETSAFFEKIPRKFEEKISAATLGEGVWRGISDVYFDCGKTEIGSCQRKETIYSNEFRIEANREASRAKQNAADASL